MEHVLTGRRACFSARVPLNIYQKEDYFGLNSCSTMKYTFNAQYTLSASLTVFVIIKKRRCYEYILTTFKYCK
jgi:hypothetical protein